MLLMDPMPSMGYFCPFCLTYNLSCAIGYSFVQIYLHYIVNDLVGVFFFSFSVNS